MKKRLLALLLVLLTLTQLAVPAAAEENVKYPRDRVGKIVIYTTATETTSWKAALHEESETEYVILMKPADIAAITGVSLDTTADTLTFTRNCYEVSVNLYAKSAEIFINTTGGECYRVYQSIFKLPEIASVTDSDGETDLYLPLEKMLYLLNASWYIENQAVYVFPTGDNMWDLLGEWAEQYTAMPTYAEVVGETVGEIWGNAFKYGLLSVADELDARIFVTGNAFITSKTEDALLELGQSAVSRLSSNEGSDLNRLLERINPGYDELLKRAESVNNLTDIITGEGAGKSLTERICESVTKWTPSQLGSDVGSILKITGAIGKTWKVIETANRSGSWPENYVAQLKYLSGVTDKHWYDTVWGDEESQIRLAAESLYTEYGKTIQNVLWEGGKELVNTAADLVLSGVGGGYYMFKQAYDAGVAILRTAVPPIDDALRNADKRLKTKSEYNIAAIAGREYVESLEDVLAKSPTQEMLDTARMLGTLMTNASAHCYYNLYVLEGDSNFLSKAQVNCGFTLRLENSAQYDERLFLSSGYQNLYSNTNGAVREQIPKEYVLFPADQVIVTVQYVSGGGEGYYYTYPVLKIYLPGNEETANAINNGKALTDLMTTSKACGEGMGEAVFDGQPGDLFYELELDSAYATTGVLALSFREVSYYGGTHPYSGVGTMAFDLVTGKELTLEGMLDPDNPTASSQLISAIASQLRTNYSGVVDSPDSAAESALEGSGSWQISDEGLTVEYAPGTISYYAAGYITVTVPYENLKGIFAKEYLPAEKKGDGTVRICGSSNSAVDQADHQFGDQSAYALVSDGRTDDVCVRIGDRVVAYANYLSGDLMWLPDAEEYTVSCGEDAQTMKP